MSVTPKLTKFIDIVIIGGGLSGSFLGRRLHEEKKEFLLLEATDRLGGRLANAAENTVPIDMGAAWIWPDHQPHMKKLVSDMKVSTFRQPNDPSSTRITKGAIDFVHRLAEPIPDERIVLKSPILSCTLINDGSAVKVETQGGDTYVASTVVMAVPPRIVAQTIHFDPPLSNEKQKAQSRAYTWMAGVTKVALVYPNRFWGSASNTGLAGPGPAFQVYDSCTEDRSIASLTFFCHVQDKPKDDAGLAQQVAQQMGRFWSRYGLEDYSVQCQSYTQQYVHRWPDHPFISEDKSPSQIHEHPSPVRALASPEWNGRLLWAGTESDQSQPGVMEGAVGAAERVLRTLIRTEEQR